MKMPAAITLLALAVLALAVVYGCGGDDPTSPADPNPADTTPPATVTDLRTVSVTDALLVLAWTAPGDDGSDGMASSYDIRSSSSSINWSTWGSCTPLATVPAPAVAGTNQTVELPSPSHPDCYVALKAVDEAGNWSDHSNVVHVDFASSGVQVYQLTTGGNNIHPCVNDGVVTWVRTSDATGQEIYIANINVAQPAPERLTDNGGEKSHPSSHGREKVVWQGRRDGIDDWEIWVYSLPSTPRYQVHTDNELDDRLPVLAGGGDFAWLQGGTMFEAVYWWNEAMHSASLISNACCPTSEYNNEWLSADDGAAVWRSTHRSGTDPPRAFLWDGTLTNISGDIEVPMTSDYSLYDGTLAYQYGASPSRITYWDGATTQDVAQGYHPSLYAGTIAYEVWDGQDWEIHYWDGAEVLEITDNDFNDTQVSLYDDRIVWVGRPAGSPDQIFYATLPR